MLFTFMLSIKLLFIGLFVIFCQIVFKISLDEFVRIVSILVRRMH